MNNDKIIFEEISETLLNPEKEVIFLFGAGTSISSGVPASAALKGNLWKNKLAPRGTENIRQSLDKIDAKLRPDEEVNIEQITFEQLMTMACDLESGKTQDEKERKIAQWLETQIPDIYTSEIKYFPSYGYEFVCHLMRNGLVKYIISMNYDEILGRAIDDELGKGRCFKVVTLEDFELLRNTDEWGKIANYFLIKPHGTRSLRRSCRYRIEYVQKFEEDKWWVLTNIIKNSILILIGFEASDYDFRNLLGDLSLNNIKKIIVVKQSPDRTIENLGGESDLILKYQGHDRDFFEKLADTLYGKNSIPNIKGKYEKFYTKATRHFIRALVYNQVNPTNNIKRQKQELIRRNDPLFFERLNILIEILIFCFKVRGLFTRKALSSCPRITSALDDYIEKAKDNKNPIENILYELRENILKQSDLSAFESWYFIPVRGNKNSKDIFKNAAMETSKFLAGKINIFLESDAKKKKFISMLTDLFARLPNDFDYDLIKDTAFYFLPFQHVELINRREQFRTRTEEILQMTEKGVTLYVMSPSTSEWIWGWAKKLINNNSTTKIIINMDVYKMRRSLHFIHISKIVRGLKKIISPKGEIRAVEGVRYGITLAFKESDTKITGKALLFLRDGKASAFSPVFLEENEARKDIDISDIYKLKIFFEDSFKKSKKL